MFICKKRPHSQVKSRYSLIRTVLLFYGLLTLSIFTSLTGLNRQLPNTYLNYVSVPEPLAGGTVKLSHPVV